MYNGILFFEMLTSDIVHYTNLHICFHEWKTDIKFHIKLHKGNNSTMFLKLFHNYNDKCIFTNNIYFKDA